MCIMDSRNLDGRWYVIFATLNFLLVYPQGIVKFIRKENEKITTAVDLNQDAKKLKQIVSRNSGWNVNGSTRSEKKTTK